MMRSNPHREYRLRYRCSWTVALTTITLGAVTIAAPMIARAQDPADGRESVNASQPPDTTPPVTPSAPAPASLNERLESLTPEEPLEYFRLGEEAMDLHENQVAQRLFVLAATLDPANFGRSACLALAELAGRTDQPDERARLLGIAQMYSSTASDDSNMNQSPAPITTDAATSQSAGSASDSGPAMVSAFLGYYRQGEGSRALRALEINPETEPLLREYGRSLGSVGSIISWLRANQRCETCRNERVLACPSCRGGADPARCSVCHDRRYIVCTTCDGDPGPELIAEQVNAMIRFEVAMLSGAGASWSAQIQLDTGRPRHVLDPKNLAASFDIDPTATIYRNGEWLAPQP